MKWHKFGMLLYDRHDGFRVSVLSWDTKQEAEDELLRWDRRTGRDNHPVYAVCVVPMYKRGKVPVRVLKRCFEQMMAKLQADRLLQVGAIDNAKRLINVKLDPDPFF